MKEKFIIKIIRFNQFLTWPISFAIFHLLFKIKISGRENFSKLHSPFIIISNHISFYDSFLFRLVLGFITPHLPLRFVAVNSFKWSFLNFLSSLGIVDFVYLIFGVFVIVPGQGIEKNLAGAIKIIEDGGNVVMYPEGEIVIGGEIAPFKKGSAVLAQRTGAEVIPVTFNKKVGKYLRDEMIINIGEIIEVSKSESIGDIVNRFREKIVELHK